MHISAHLIAAAAAGRTLPRLWMAFLIGIIGHIVLDMAPQPTTARWIGNWDALILAFGVFLAFRLPRKQKFAALTCGLGCILPDVEGILIYLMPSAYPTRLFPTHNGFIRQWEPPIPWGQIVQTALILVGAWVLWRSREKKPELLENPGRQPEVGR